MSNLWGQIVDFFTPKLSYSKTPAAQDPVATAHAAIKGASKGSKSSSKSSSHIIIPKTPTNSRSVASNLQATNSFIGRAPQVAAPKMQVAQPSTQTVAAPQADTGAGQDMSGYFNGGQPFTYNGQTYDPTAQGFDLMSLMNLSPDEISQLSQLADQQAKSQNDLQRQALDNLLKQATNTYNGNVANINNQKTDAQQQLDNQSFQDYLKSRQDIADRGLASSGLANDANTRLMLNRNQALSSLFKQADTQLNDAKSQFDTTSNDIGSKRALINDSSTAASLLQQLKQSALDSKQKQAQMMMEWNKWITPSGDTMAKASSDQAIANLANQTKWQIAQLNNDTSLKINENNNATDLQKTSMNIQMQQQQLDSLNWNRQQQQYISSAKAQYGVANQILSSLAKDPKNKALQNSYQQAISSANAAVNQAMNVTNSGFSNSSGGSGGKANYTSGNAAFNQNMQAAVSRGVPSSWVSAMTEIARRESSWNPSALNKSSGTYGYAQFQPYNITSYDKKMGLNYKSSPVDQLVEMAAYIKDRYGTAQNALSFWNNNGWY